MVNSPNVVNKHQNTFIREMLFHRFIGSKIIFVCDGALPDLGIAVVHLFFWRGHGGDREQGWMTFRRGTSFSEGRIVIFLPAVSFVQICMTRMIISCGDHMCNVCKRIVK
jgi:hypothetical protein